MKVTAKHLAYGSVLGVGAVALLLDSAFPPASAAAAYEAPVSEATAIALASAVSAYAMPLDTGLAPLANHLAERNQRHAVPVEDTRDAFAFDGQAWGVEKTPEPQDDAIGTNTQSDLTLTAIMANDGVGVAVINGMMVRVGDHVRGGYRVASIKPRSVVLDLDGHTLVLGIREER